MNVIQRTRRVTNYEMTLTGQCLLDMLRARGHGIPDDALITVTVPRGGDYGGIDLDVRDIDTPLTIRWSVTEEGVKP